jgi:hypothetical protein
MATTFEFRSEKSYIKVWEALNDTYIPFASYGYKAITVFSENGANMVREACTDAGIKFKEI